MPRRELSAQDFGLSENDPLLREPEEYDVKIDPRSLCSMKDCNERAFSLMAWPRRFPLPVCEAHTAEIKQLVNMEPFNKFRPYDWVQLLRKIGKSHLFGKGGK